jgi:hypothetical protein
VFFLYLRWGYAHNIAGLITHHHLSSQVLAEGRHLTRIDRRGKEGSQASGRAYDRLPADSKTRIPRVYPYKLWSRSGFLDIKESIDVNSSMINKIAKAKRYAEEPERIQFTQFEATFRGENDVHTTHYNDGEWNCTCRFFHDWGDCSHTMAMQRILGVTIPAAHRHGIPTGLGTGPLAH